MRNVISRFSTYNPLPGRLSGVLAVKLSRASWVIKTASISAKQHSAPPFAHAHKSARGAGGISAQNGARFLRGAWACSVLCSWLG